jgi:predicted RNA-binding protein
MCDLKAYLKDTNNEERLVLESVNFARNENGEVLLKNLFGEEKRVRGTIREVSLVKNRMLVEQS